MEKEYYRVKKYNNGNGAILCSECSVILKEGFATAASEGNGKRISNEDWASNEPLFCEECLGKIKKSWNAKEIRQLFEDGYEYLTLHTKDEFHEWLDKKLNTKTIEPIQFKRVESEITMTVLQAYANYCKWCAGRLRVGGSFNEFKDKLIISDDFNKRWSFGCTAELTIDERRKIWEGLEWNRSTDMSFHNMNEKELLDFLNEGGIPKRRIRKTII